MEDDLDQLRDTAWGLMNTERSMLVYNSSIAKKIAKNFPYKGNVLEFGAGIGTLATLFKTTEGLKPKCLETDPNL
jgi:16S rRNA A1518/A1519 N6-dimethyltransferase RsmA/KsgA/DIM1 with predicted DNA glycosylase/AP lyase activity